MNDELKTKLLQYLNGLEVVAKDAVMAGKQEIPEFLKELIRWEIISSLWIALVAIAAAAACILITAKVVHWSTYEKPNVLGETISPAIMLAIFPGIGVCIALAALSDSALSAGKAYFAPRVFIVEKMASIVKGTQ